MSTGTWSFLDHVTASIRNQRSGDAKHPTLWPSEASAVVTIDGKQKVLGKCRRAVFFRYLTDSYKFYDKYSFWKTLFEDVENLSLPIDTYMLWIHRQGELYEEYLVEQAKISGVYISGQLQVYIKEFNVSGKKDVEVINPLTHKYSIVEAKSVYGHNGNHVLGTPSERKQGSGGTPRDSNLMQIALYHWWCAQEDPTYEESRLSYGSRDTGRYAEYLVDTQLKDNAHVIRYRLISPNEGKWVESPITIENILEQYKYIQQCVDGGVIPERDFNLVYSEEDLEKAYLADEMTKTNREMYEKVIERRKENVALIAEGKKPKKELKQVKMGDFNCNYCKYKQVCYDSEGVPKEL